MAEGADKPMIHVEVTTMGGDQHELPPMPNDALVKDLALQIRTHTGYPIATQKLVFNGSVLADVTVTLQEVFGEERQVELTAIQLPLEPHEQMELNISLVRAIGCGSEAQVRELLMEGARVDSDCVDTEVEHAGDQQRKDERESDDDEEEEERESNDSSDMSVDGIFGGHPAHPTGQPRTIVITPLMMAVAADYPDLANYMRSLGAEEPDMTPQSDSIVEAFTADDYADVFRHIAAGADVNGFLRRGQGVEATSRGVPLHACCAHAGCPGSYEVAQLLLRKRADTTLGDSEGDTPLAHAKYFHADQIYDLLQNNGAKIDGPFYRMFGRMRN